MAAAESTVWTWGRAKNYRLGRAFVGTDARIPEKVSGFEGVAVRHAACGGGHTAVVLEDNRLFVFGYSQYGQLGLGDRNDMCDATQVFLIPPDGIDLHSPRSIKKIVTDKDKTNNFNNNNNNNEDNKDDEKEKTGNDNNNNNNNNSEDSIKTKTNTNADANDNKTKETSTKTTIQMNSANNITTKYHNNTNNNQSSGRLGSSAVSLPVAEVACGRYHTIARTHNGLVFTWGGGKNGRLGHGDEKIRAQPTWVEHLRDEIALSVTAGYHNNLVLTSRGQVWSWGWGAHGQLGLGDQNDRDIPTVIEELSEEKVVLLSCGDRHSFAVTQDGKVYGWGSNEFGQLGCGKKHDTVLKPCLIEGLHGLKIICISSGDRHSAAVTNTGAVYTWGCGTDGQCGHGVLHDVVRPKLVEHLVGKFVIDVKCGHNFTMVMTSNDEIFTWGNNTYGQLGNNGNGKSHLPVRVVINSEADVHKVSCGHFHCIMWMRVASNEKNKDNHQRSEEEGEEMKKKHVEDEKMIRKEEDLKNQQFLKSTQQKLKQHQKQLKDDDISLDQQQINKLAHLKDARHRLSAILDAYAKKRDECRQVVDQERVRHMADLDGQDEQIITSS